MKHRFLVVGTAIAVLLWLSGARARADLIQWSAWGSGSSVGPNGYSNWFVNATNNGSGGNEYILLAPQGNGNIIKANFQSVTVVGLDTYVAGNYNGSTSTEFGGPSGQYQLSVGLYDKGSRTRGNLTFSGYFSGNLPLQGAGSWGGPYTLTNTFTSPTTQTLMLGSGPTVNLYTVTLGPVDLPKSVYPEDWGSISAFISVRPILNPTPEPSSLLLACLGLPPLGFARWLRRREAGREGSGS